MRNRAVIILSIVVVALACSLLVVLLAMTVDPADLLATLYPSAPIVAATVAALSLALNAWSTWAGWRRRQRQATIEAWSSWSDETADARKLLTSKVGTAVISANQANALLDKSKTFIGRDDAVLTVDERREVVRAMILVLNGLERLAVGEKLGVYDTAALTDLGGTIIVRSRDRFAPYIVLRQETTDIDRRQRRAYTELMRLADDIQQRHIDEERVRRLKSR